MKLIERNTVFIRFVNDAFGDVDLLPECARAGRRWGCRYTEDDLHDIDKNIGADEWVRPQKTVATCKAWAN